MPPKIVRVNPKVEGENGDANNPAIKPHVHHRGSMMQRHPSMKHVLQHNLELTADEADSILEGVSDSSVIPLNRSITVGDLGDDDEDVEEYEDEDEEGEDTVGPLNGGGGSRISPQAGVTLLNSKEDAITEPGRTAPGPRAAGRRASRAARARKFDRRTPWQKWKDRWCVLKTYTSGLPTFDPEDAVKITWDTIMLIFILYYVFLAPYEFAFGEVDYPGSVAIDYIGDTFFILDLLIAFRTGFRVERHGDRRCHNGELVTAPGEIARRYIGGRYFWIDLLSLGVPYWRQGLAVRSPLRWMKGLKMLRLLRLHRVIHVVRKAWEGRNGTSHVATRSYARIMVLFVMLVVFSHFVGCCFFAIGKWHANEDDEVNWLDMTLVVDETEQGGYEDGYMASVSWAVHALLAGGYGEVAPTNASEYLFGDLVLLAGAVFFAAWLGSVSAVISSMTVEEGPLVAAEGVHEHLFKRFGVGEGLARRMQEITRFQWELNRSYGSENAHGLDATLSCLPMAMQQEVRWALHEDLLSKVHLFRNLPVPPVVFLRAVAMVLRQELCLAGDIVIEAGDVGRSMYLLHRGEMEVLDAAGTEVGGGATHGGRAKAIALLREGAFFGELAIIVPHLRRQNTIRARSRCEYFSLAREDLEKVYEDFPEARAHVRTQAESRLKNMLEDPHQRQPHDKDVTLHVTVVCGKDIKPKSASCTRWLANPSSYVKVRTTCEWLNETNQTERFVAQRRKTSVAKHTTQPEWRQSFVFDLGRGVKRRRGPRREKYKEGEDGGNGGDDKEEEEMKPMEIARQWQETGELWVEVYNRRTLCGDEQCRADDFIGTFNIELAEVATHENGIDGWFKLVPPPDDSAAGLFGIKPRAVPGYVKLRMHVRSRRRARSVLASERWRASIKRVWEDLKRPVSSMDDAVRAIRADQASTGYNDTQFAVHSRSPFLTIAIASSFSSFFLLPSSFQGKLGQKHARIAAQLEALLARQEAAEARVAAADEQRAELLEAVADVQEKVDAVGRSMIELNRSLQSSTRVTQQQLEDSAHKARRHRHERRRSRAEGGGGGGGGASPPSKKEHITDQLSPHSMRREMQAIKQEGARDADALAAARERERARQLANMELRKQQAVPMIKKGVHELRKQSAARLVPAAAGAEEGAADEGGGDDDADEDDDDQGGGGDDNPYDDVAEADDAEGRSPRMPRKPSEAEIEFISGKGASRAQWTPARDAASPRRDEEESAKKFQELESSWAKKDLDYLGSGDGVDSVVQKRLEMQLLAATASKASPTAAARVVEAGDGGGGGNETHDE